MRIKNSFDSDLEKALRLADPDERKLWVTEAQFAVGANFMASLANTYTREGQDIIAAKIAELYPSANNIAYTADLESIETDLRRLGKLKQYDRRITKQPTQGTYSDDGGKTWKVGTPPQADERTDEDKLVEQVRADLGFFEIPDDPEEQRKLGLKHMTSGISSIEIEQKCSNSPAYKRAYNRVKAEAIAGGYGQSLAPKATPTVAPEVQQFAHMFNDHCSHNSPPKPAAGFYVLKVGGKEYKYPYESFKNLSEQAAVAGLI